MPDEVAELLTSLERERDELEARMTARRELERAELDQLEKLAGELEGRRAAAVTSLEVIHAQRTATEEALRVLTEAAARLRERLFAHLWSTMAVTLFIGALATIPALFIDHGKVPVVLASEAGAAALGWGLAALNDRRRRRRA